MPEGAAGDAASEARSSAVAGIRPLPLPNRSCHRSDSPGWTQCPRPLLASAASKSVSLPGWCDPSELLFRLFVAVRRSGLTPVCKRQNRRSRGIFKFTGLSTTFLRYPPDFFTVHSVVHQIHTMLSTETTPRACPTSASEHNKGVSVCHSPAYRDPFVTPPTGGSSLLASHQPEHLLRGDEWP